MNQTLYKTLVLALGEEQVIEKEPMSKHTTFRIGGNADLFVIPQNAEQVKQVVCHVKEAQVPYYFIGNGSNLLVADDGIRGVVILIADNMKAVEVDETTIRAQAGISLASLAKEALRNELKGLEFAAGIPGTLGGAVSMNAGAYGGEMKDVLLEATVLTDEGEIVTLSKEELELGYRTSLVGRNHYIVLEAVVALEKGQKEEILLKMEDLAQRRRDKQPLEYPSAGSTFKRPEGYFAGQLIDETGLRGFQVGGAQVSEKHCGFVINTGNATSHDVRQLIEEVANRVEKKFGVRLHPEVKMIGFENDR